MGRGVGINDYEFSILMSSKTVNRTFGLLRMGYPGIGEQKMVGYPAITERSNTSTHGEVSYFNRTGRFWLNENWQRQVCIRLQ
jgi:hypothetical protein